MADGVTGGNLENAVSAVERERKSVHVPAPIPLRLMVEPPAQGPVQIQKLVTMARAPVSDYMVKYKKRYSVAILLKTRLAFNLKVPMK